MTVLITDLNIQKGKDITITLSPDGRVTNPETGKKLKAKAVFSDWKGGTPPVEGEYLIVEAVANPARWEAKEKRYVVNCGFFSRVVPEEHVLWKKK